MAGSAAGARACVQEATWWENNNCLYFCLALHPMCISNEL